MVEDMMQVTKANLEQDFLTSTYKYGLVISMLSLERLWQPFKFAVNKRKMEIETEVRECMDMLWERIWNGAYSKEVFLRKLDRISLGYAEDDLKSMGNPCVFDNYLINGLYASVGYFFGNFEAESFKVKTSASMAVFELLSDYLVDLDIENSSEGIQLILNEINRITYDQQFLKENNLNQLKIMGLKEHYMHLEILAL